MNTFIPKTETIKKLSIIYPERIKELEQIFNKKSNIYIDYANVIHWSKKLNWRIDLRRLKQLFDSFRTIKAIHFYNGTLVGEQKSENLMKDAKKYGYEVHTKPVKIMKLSIDVSSIPIDSPSILNNFIKRPLLAQLNIETVEYLNQRLKELNDRGIRFLEHKKCNFDVEIGRDMLVDYDKNAVENFILFSGDSDFADPVKQLLDDKKKVIIFGTARRISVELASTGALIYEIRKIKNFICWSREIPDEIKNKL